MRNRAAGRNCVVRVRTWGSARRKRGVIVVVFLRAESDVGKGILKINDTFVKRGLWRRRLLPLPMTMKEPGMDIGWSDDCRSGGIVQSQIRCHRLSDIAHL